MKKLIIATMMLSINFAFAAGRAASHSADSGGSQFTHQAADGMIELTAGYQAQDLTIKYTAAAAPQTSTKLQNSTVSGTFEYGLSSYFSVGVEGGSATDKNTNLPSGSATDYTQSGMTDPQIFLNARFGDAFSVHFRLEAAFSPGHQKLDSNNNQTNEYSGGNSANASAAFEYNAGYMIFGAFAADDIYKGDRTGDGAGGVTETTTGDGQMTVGAYLETAPAMFSLGLAYRNISVADEKVISNGTTTDQHSSATIQVYELYIPMNFGVVTVIPDVAYIDYAYKETQTTANVSSLNGMREQISLRFAF